MKRREDRRYYEVRKPLGTGLNTYNLDADLYQHARERGWSINGRRTDLAAEIAYVTLGPMTDAEAVELKMKFADLFETWELVGR